MSAESLVTQIARLIEPRAYVDVDAKVASRFAEWQAGARRAAEAKAIEILKLIRGAT
jgi:hypothetical protein